MVNEPLPWVRNTETGNSMVLSEPPSFMRMPRAKTVWFQLNSPLLLYDKNEVNKQSKHLPWVRNTKIGNSMVLSEPPSCVGTPRSRTKQLPVKILPCLYTATVRSERGTPSLSRKAR